MTLSEIRDTYSWQGAIELGPKFSQLAEDLPAAEQMGLSLQLREGVVSLASGIALDLMKEGAFTRRRHAVRLVATLDLIDRVYPALDTAGCRDALLKLLDRLQSETFAETQTPPAPPAGEIGVEAPALAAAASADTASEDAPTPDDERAAMPQNQPAAAESAGIIHVQPNRVQ